MLEFKLLPPLQFFIYLFRNTPDPNPHISDGPSFWQANQWIPLTHSPRWDKCHLWRGQSSLTDGCRHPVEQITPTSTPSVYTNIRAPEPAHMLLGFWQHNNANREENADGPIFFNYFNLTVWFIVRSVTYEQTKTDHMDEAKRKTKWSCLDNKKCLIFRCGFKDSQHPLDEV